MVEDLRAAINFFKQYVNETSVVAHSLGTCIIAEYINSFGRSQFDKIILLAPALNQRDLLRYWFVVSKNKCKKLIGKILENI